MSPAKDSTFQDVYSRWSSDRLVRAATLEKADYCPEAIDAMLAELAARGMTKANVDDVSARRAPPPLPLPKRQEWISGSRLGRRSYAIRFAILAVAVGVALFAVNAIPSVAVSGTWIVGLTSVAYWVVGLLVPRSRDAGIPSSMAFVFILVPGFVAILGFALFFIPTKKSE